MQTLLISYVSASISASVLLLLLLLCKPLWKHRLSKSWQYYIWALVVMRLLIPISPAPGVIGAVMNEDTYSIGNRAYFIDSDNKNQELTYVPPMESTKQNEPDSTAVPYIGVSFPSWFLSHIWLIWITPAAMLMIFRLICYHRCVHSLKSSGIPKEEPECLEICRHVKAELNITTNIPIFHCQAVLSPMITGLINPVILLPETNYTPTQLYYIFRHELLHYKRKDLLYKWLVEASVCIHWFNPLIYVLRRECDHLCELSCDEAVIAKLTEKEKIAYGDTLISFIRNSSTSPKAPAATLLCENASILKERLVSIMETKKSTLLQKSAAFGITALLSCSLLLLGGAVAKAEVTNKLNKTEASAVTDPWLNDSNNPESKKWRHNFMTSGFFANGYGIKLAWNNDSSLYKTTRQISAVDSYTVSFTEDVARYADDAQVLEAIRLAMLVQRDREKDVEESGTDGMWSGNFTMTHPVVVAIDGPYDGTNDELAVRFYEEERPDYFSFVVGNASVETQSALAERSYRDDNIKYFSILSNNIQPETLLSYAKQFYEDNKINFFSVIFSKLPKTEQKNFAYRSYEDGNLGIFSIAVSALDSYEYEALQKQAKDIFPK